MTDLDILVADSGEAMARDAGPPRRQSDKTHLLDKILTQRIVVLDGAMGTMCPGAAPPAACHTRHAAKPAVSIAGCVTTVSPRRSGGLPGLSPLPRSERYFPEWSGRGRWMFHRVHKGDHRLPSESGRHPKNSPGSSGCVCRCGHPAHLVQPK